MIMYSCLYESLIQEAKAIISAAERLDKDQVEAILSKLTECQKRKSKIIFSGVGKSGLVGRKIAATFASLGISSIFLNPLDAFHGDLGVVSQNDVCFLISNSGDTKELVDLIPYLKSRNNYIIALVGNPHSKIAIQSNAILDAKVDKEICPLNLAPTCSTAVAMSIGDALAVEWMYRNNFSPNDFAINHPAGNLGKRLTLTVKDLMIPIHKIKPLNVNSSLLEILNLITSDGLGFAWVQNTEKFGEMIGIITDGDLRRTLAKQPLNRWDQLYAKDFITFSPLSVTSDCLAIDALKLMEKNPKKRVSMLPVIDTNKISGFVNIHTLVNAGIKND